MKSVLIVFVIAIWLWSSVVAQDRVDARKAEAKQRAARLKEPDRQPKKSAAMRTEKRGEK